VCVCVRVGVCVWLVNSLRLGNTAPSPLVGESQLGGLSAALSGCSERHLSAAANTRTVAAHALMSPTDLYVTAT